MRATVGDATSRGIPVATRSGERADAGVGEQLLPGDGLEVGARGHAGYGFGGGPMAQADTRAW